MSKIEVNQISSQCGSTLTIGQSGDTVTLACGASQTGFGRTGTVNWDTTAKTAGFTAVSGEGYFVNTTSGAITVTLPAGSAGSIVSLKDYANTWDTNNVTVTPNGTDKINGGNGDATLNTQDQSVTLVYVDSTKGWRAVQDSTSDVTGALFVTATGGCVTCCGDYKIHTFTGPGTFTVTCAGNTAGSNTVDYLVVAGGGATFNNASAGGGAGGFRESVPNPAAWSASPLANPGGSLPVTATGYPITVGGGGAGAGNNPGSNSIFSTITSAGGGFGGGNNPPGDDSGGPGGSGGGARGVSIACTQGGTGNTPPVSPPQGQPGGSALGSSVPGAAGGGGATQAGTNASAPAGGPGGNGAQTSISGSATYYAGGGGGSTDNQSPPFGAGGLGGGGQGGPSCIATSGTANTGGGGGGSRASGTSGGSGIVIIRYKYQ